MARINVDYRTGSVLMEPESIWEAVVMAWRLYRYPEKYKVLGYLKDEDGEAKK
jgi:hypothetical protein